MSTIPSAFTPSYLVTGSLDACELCIDRKYDVEEEEKRKAAAEEEKEGENKERHKKEKTKR